MPPKKQRKVDAGVEGNGTAKGKGKGTGTHHDAEVNSGDRAENSTKGKGKGGATPRNSKSTTVPEWTSKQQELLVHSILHNGTADRKIIYRTPGLEPWNVNGGDRINRKIQTIVRKICEQFQVKLLDVSAGPRGARKGGGRGGSGSSNSKRQRDHGPDDGNGGGGDGEDNDEQAEQGQEEEDDDDERDDDRVPGEDDQEQDEDEPGEDDEQNAHEQDDDDENLDEDESSDDEQEFTAIRSELTEDEEQLHEEEGESDDDARGQVDIADSTTTSPTKQHTFSASQLNKALKTANSRKRHLTVKQWHLANRMQTIQIHMDRLHQLRNMKSDRKMVDSLLRAEINYHEDVYGVHHHRRYRAPQNQSPSRRLSQSVSTSSVADTEVTSSTTLRQDITSPSWSFQTVNSSAEVVDDVNEVHDNHITEIVKSVPRVRVPMSFTPPPLTTSTFRPLYTYQANNTDSSNEEEEDEICSLATDTCQANHPHHWPQLELCSPESCCRLPFRQGRAKAKHINYRIFFAGLEYRTLQVPLAGKKIATCAESFGFQAATAPVVVA